MGIGNRQDAKNVKLPAVEDPRMAVGSSLEGTRMDLATLGSGGCDFLASLETWRSQLLFSVRAALVSITNR